MLDILKKYLCGNLIWVKCGGFNCTNVFQVRNEIAKPDIYICKTCQEKFNQGIVSYIHAHTGKLKGSYHILDGYSN